jgi:hypothetical protein
MIKDYFSKASKDNLVNLLNEMLDICDRDTITYEPVHSFIMSWCNDDLPDEAVRLLRRFGYSTYLLHEFKSDLDYAVDKYKIVYNPFEDQFE